MSLNKELGAHVRLVAAAGLLATVEGAYRLATLAPGTIAEGTAAQTVRAMAEGLIDSSVGPVRGGTERDKSE